MRTQVPLSSDARADDETDGRVQEVLHDLATRRLIIANVAWIGRSGSSGWVLVDAGIPGTAGTIARISDERFSSPPMAIVLTHGHFDHVGGLRSLAERWNVPIYAHALELPYLNGTAAYPPPDPTVGGGLMSTLSRVYPREPVDVSPWLQRLPQDGSIPPLPQWRWVHTPGHTPGHISLWRESDRTLIAGDAVITTRQESAYAALTQEPEMHGPPAYYTQDWMAARDSVEHLAALQPETLVTGHGHAMRGEEMRRALQRLARDFDRLAIPESGRYVADPALPEDGTAYRRPRAAKESPTMAGTRDKGDLPVTAEVGSEGGSYADPTVQVATRTGRLPRVDRSEPDDSTPGAVADAVTPTPDGPEDGVRVPREPESD